MLAAPHAAALALTSIKHSLVWCLPHMSLVTPSCTVRRSCAMPPSSSPRLTSSSLQQTAHSSRARGWQQRCCCGRQGTAPPHTTLNHQPGCMPAAASLTRHPTGSLAGAHRWPAIGLRSTTTTSRCAVFRAGAADSSHLGWRATVMITAQTMSPHNCEEGSASERVGRPAD